MNLSALATGTTENRFAADLLARDSDVRSVVEGGRVLLIGGAGSIGSATLRALLPFGPRSIHVVDTDENGLAELALDLRCSGVRVPHDLRLIPLDYGSHAMSRLLREEQRYDAILNFAAVKHVHSGLDIYSALQLCDTNIVKQARFLSWMREVPPGRYFSVSTDKAVAPVNLMGASKRIMEMLLFGSGIDCPVTSARFANVAGSNGSIMHAWSQRIAKGQYITVPGGMQRYFVSREEAGTICLLAALATDNKNLLIPALTDQHLVSLEALAGYFLRAQDKEPIFVRSEAEARSMTCGKFEWPVLVTPYTTHEKSCEVFVRDCETADDCGLSMLKRVAGSSVESLCLERLACRLQSFDGSMADLCGEIREVVPAWEVPCTAR